MRNLFLFDISKSNTVKGTAIVLMLCHHLFAFPLRLGSDSNYLSLFPLIGNLRIEQIIGGFGVICVPMFLFVSGYGLFLSCSKSNSVFRDTIKRIWSFLIMYWVIFLIFIPVAFLLFYSGRVSNPNVLYTSFYNGEYRYAFSLESFLANFFTLSVSYNEEWWFVLFYIKVLALSPLLYFILRKSALFLFVAYSFCLGILAFFHVYNAFLIYMIPFLLGMVFAKALLFDRINAVEIFQSKLVVSLGGVILAVLYYWLYYKFEKSNTLAQVTAITLVPLIIFSSLKEFSLLGIKTGYLETMGKYSSVIWLTHTFYCYYLFQGYIFAPKLSLLILIWLLAISLAVAFCLTPVIRKVQSLLSF